MQDQPIILHTILDQSLRKICGFLHSVQCVKLLQLVTRSNQFCNYFPLQKSLETNLAAGGQTLFLIICTNQLTVIFFLHFSQFDLYFVLPIYVHSYILPSKFIQNSKHLCYILLSVSLRKTWIYRFEGHSSQTQGTCKIQYNFYLGFGLLQNFVWFNSFTTNHFSS